VVSFFFLEVVIRKSRGDKLGIGVTFLAGVSLKRNYAPQKNITNDRTVVLF